MKSCVSKTQSTLPYSSKLIKMNKTHSSAIGVEHNSSNGRSGSSTHQQVSTPILLDCESVNSNGLGTPIPVTTPLSSSIGVQSPVSATSSLNLLDCNSISSFTSPNSTSHLFSNNNSSQHLDPKMNESSSSNHHYPTHFQNNSTGNSANNNVGGNGANSALSGMVDWVKIEGKSAMGPPMYSYPPQNHPMMHHSQQAQQSMLPPHYFPYMHPGQGNGGFNYPSHQGYFQPPQQHPQDTSHHQYLGNYGNSIPPHSMVDSAQQQMTVNSQTANQHEQHEGPTQHQHANNNSNTEGPGSKSSGSSSSASDSSSDESVQPVSTKKKKSKKTTEFNSMHSTNGDLTSSAPYSPTNTTFTESAIDDQQGGNFQLAQIACTNCRSRHKKCSRELPVCNYCKKMAKDCIYLKSRKGQDQQNRKKKKKKKERGETQATPATSSVNDTPPSLSTSNVTTQNNTIPSGIPTASPAIPSISVTSSFSNHANTPHSVVAQSSSSGSSHNEMSPLPSSLHGSSPLLTHQFNPMAYSERDFKDPNSISVMLSSFVHSINFRYTAHKLLDLYYKELCAGFALVDKSLMEGLIEQLMGNDGNSNSSMILNHMQLDSTTQDGLISILYSIQALALQQSGDYVLKGDYRQKLMEYLHNLAKEKISKYFDNMDNIYIAVALHYLTDYVCGEGDMRKTSLYLAMVKQMIGLHGYGGPNDQQVGATNSCYSSQDSPSLPKFLLRILVRYKETFLSDYMSKVTGKPNSAMKLFGVFASRIKLDTSFFQEKGQISSQYLPLIENVVRISHTYYSLLFETMYQAQGDIFCIFSNIFIREFYLDLYSKVENTPATVLVSYANEIISYTKVEKYIFAPFVIANGVAKAVAVRLEYWRQTGEPMDFKDDLRALKVLSSRYGVVQKLYGDLINQIENATLLQSMNETNNSRLFGTGTLPPDAMSYQTMQQQQPQPLATPQVMAPEDMMQQFDEAIAFSPLMDPFNPNSGNLLSMLFNEVGNERCESLNEESYFLDDPQVAEAPQDRDHNPFIKGYSLVKMMIKQLSKLKDALHIPDPKAKEESLKKAKTELIEELSKALPNDIEAKFILELTKHQHPHQIHPCQYSHLALLFE